MRWKPENILSEIRNHNYGTQVLKIEYKLMLI